MMLVLCLYINVSAFNVSRRICGMLRTGIHLLVAEETFISLAARNQCGGVKWIVLLI